MAYNDEFRDIYFSRKRKSSCIQYNTDQETNEEKSKKKKTGKLTELEKINIENYHKKLKSLEKARAIKAEKKRREKAGKDPSLAKQVVERRMAEEEEARKRAGQKSQEEHIETRYEELPDDEEKREKMLHSLDKSMQSLERAREARVEQARQDKELTEEEEEEEEERETDTEYEEKPTPSKRKSVKRKAIRKEAQGDTYVYLIKRNFGEGEGNCVSLAIQAVERRMAEEEKARKRAGKNVIEEHFDTSFELQLENKENRDKTLNLERTREAKSSKK